MLQHGGGAHTRRSYLKTALAAGASVGLLSSLAGCADQRTTSSGDRPVRRSLASLAASDPDGIIDSYAEAVRQMRDLPDSDPRSWRNQAFVHGVPSGFTECEHSNWLFLPWHRAYLFFFEDICRDLSGNPDFALPFWNWVDNPGIPAAFQGDASNPLFDGSRFTPSFNDSFVGTSAISTLLSEPNFLRFGGGDLAATNPSLPTGTGAGDAESPPHNHVHSRVGGTMGSYTSPLDPLFWTHHCMVDYLWWEWNVTRRNPNANDSDWVTTEFGGDFVDVDGNVVENVSVLRTLLMPFVGYTYEPTPISQATPRLAPLAVANALTGTLGGQQVEENGTATPNGTATDGGERDGDDDDLERFLEEGAEVELELLERFELAEAVEVAVGDPVTVETELTLEDLRPFLTGEAVGRIELAALEIPPPRTADVVVTVFVNLPEADAETPQEPPHFGGGVAFFGPGEHPTSVSIDLTDTLFTLLRREVVEPDEPLTVQLVAAPSGEDPRDVEVTVGRLNLDVTRSVIDGEVVERLPRLQGDEE
jgi:tyrosinase